MSKTRDGATVRKERIDFLLNFIEKNPDGIDERIVLKVYSRRFGLTKERMLEHLRECEELGFIERRDGKLAPAK